jgi:hypothetical protein
MNRFFYVFEVNFIGNPDQDCTISLEHSSLQTALMIAKINAASMSQGCEFTVSLSKSYNA